MDQFYGIEHQSEPEMLYSFCAEGKAPQTKSHCVFCTQPFSVTRMSEDWRVISRQLRRVLSASVIRRMSSRRSKCRQLFQEDIPRAADEIRAFLVGRYGAANEKFVKNLSYLHVFQRFLKEKDLEQYDLFHAQDLFAVFLLGYLNQTYRRPLLRRTDILRKAG